MRETKGGDMCEKESGLRGKECEQEGSEVLCVGADVKGGV